MAQAQAQNAEMRTLIQSLGSRLESMEGKITDLSEKLDAASRARSVDPKAPKLSGVSPHPSEGAGERVEAKPSETDPDVGFVNDDAVSSYRQAMVNFRAGRFSDSILAFSAFMERFANHPLAGAAQYHLGESYFRQKEYQLAIQEFQRVLTSYDRSSHVADALRELAAASDHLKRPDDAARYRQQLMSMFPQSPAALSVASREETASEEPAKPQGIDPVPTASQGARTPQGSLDQPPPPTAPVPGQDHVP